MDDIFELDLHALSWLNYHWFWGLRYGKAPPSVTMDIEVTHLLNDKEALYRIIEEHLTAYQKPAVVRFFYWLFNINNYAHNAYLLMAYKAHQDYLYHSQKDNHAMEFKEMFSWSYLSKRMANIKKRIYDFLSINGKLPLLKHDASQSEVFEEQAEEISSPSIDAGAAKITVTSSMLPHLEELNFHLKLGDSLALSDFKAGCRKRFLATHPDKGGSADAFRRARDAAQSLTDMIFSRSSSSNMGLYSEWKDFYTWANVTRADLEKISEDLKIIAADNKIIAADAKIIAADAKIIAADNKIIKAALDKIIKLDAEISLQVAANMADLVELNARISTTVATMNNMQGIIDYLMDKPSSYNATASSQGFFSSASSSSSSSSSAASESGQASESNVDLDTEQKTVSPH